MKFNGVRTIRYIATTAYTAFCSNRYTETHSYEQFHKFLLKKKIQTKKLTIFFS